MKKKKKKKKGKEKKEKNKLMIGRKDLIMLKTDLEEIFRKFGK